jgi:nucleoid-associated protein YgaU/chitinase
LPKIPKSPILTPQSPEIRGISAHITVGGKDMSLLPPRNVIYFNARNNQITLPGIAQLPYTDVIIANLQPTSASNLTLQGYGPAFDDNLQSNIQALRNAGKNVLISFGGAQDQYLTTAAYQSYAQNVNGLVSQLVNFVIQNGFNGVDIDDEDDPGYTGTYNGVGFLVALTKQLYQALPSGQNIITHAPAPGYWFPGTYNNAYTQIWQQAADEIAWINCQFYDNDVDTAAAKVNTYQQIANITGPQKLLVGALVGDPSILGTGDTGYITLSDMINNVIAPLEAQFGSKFGGVMGWEFAQDGPPTYGGSGAWANGIGQALTAPPPATTAPPPATLTPQQYTVQSGDTLASIAQRFYGDSTLWTLIQAANSEINPNNLQIGQQLQIPFGQQHTVQSGDTLNNVAQRVYNNSSWWPLIQDANPGINPNNLQIGQLLQIPFGLQYTVQSGDTLASIAQRFYGDSSQWTLIQNANPGINPNNLQIGQLLLIQFAQQYTVQSADTLVKIAEQFYGNGSQWTLIQNANPGINPNNLQVGQQLQIPAN